MCVYDNGETVVRTDVSLLVWQGGRPWGDEDVGEVGQDEEEQDSLRLLSVWSHSLTLTNGETLYVYESH